jgi:hemolysin activation/secretion protein
MTPPFAAYALAPANPLAWTGRSLLRAVAGLLFLLAPALARASAPPDVPPPLQPASPTSDPAAGLVPPKDNTPRFYIQEFRVDGGGRLLTRDETETAVYPYLGPYRTAQDVEQARAALEQAYRDKGYQTVTVSVPAQHARSGIVHLAVSLGELGRVRVIGSRFFSIDEIKREAPSLQEGTSPNFTQVTHDLVALNQLSDRKITPTVRAGEIPGTVDVDLNVKDTFPLHGSLELNNRYSANTTPLRVNGAVDYDNLWQLGHAIGFSFQVSPQYLALDQPFGGAPGSQAKVFSGYYLARLPDVSWLTLMVQGTDQNSNVNTLGGIGVAGKGKTLGGRAVITLPQLPGYYHSLSLGLDYKTNRNLETSASGTQLGISAPVTYYLLSSAYSGSWIGKGSETDLNASANFSLRGWDSSPEEFDINRYKSDGGFIYFRGDLSRTQEIGEGFQAFAKVQGQAADKPLVSGEEFSAGGLGTVRGYLESEDLGDNGICETVELRTPSLGDFLGKPVDEWRFYIFGDAGLLTINDALPEQQEKFKLASVGAGTRIKLQDHYNGSFDFGLPLDNAPNTQAYEPLMTFRVWAEF